MKKSIPSLVFSFILSACFFCSPLYAQTPEDKSDSTGKEETLTKVEIMPEFPGGEKGLFKFLGDNLVYPSKARKLGYQGKVYVSFIVDIYGQVRNVTIARGVAKELDDEAVRVIKLMPRWTPGKQDGKPVNVKFTLPINFSLD